MIKNYKIGDTITDTLLVVSASARETKAKKPFLSLVLTDGTDQIACNYWDWSSGKIPTKNTIVDIEAGVTEWQNNKQLNIKAINANLTAAVTEFIPKAEIEPAHIFDAAVTLAESIVDPYLRKLTTTILSELEARWLTVPGAITVHHAYQGGTLAHSFSVAKMAKAIAECFPSLNIDLCIAGGLLHDVGKLFAYKFEGATIELTDEGKLYDHTFLGARFISNFVEEIKWIDVASDESGMFPVEHESFVELGFIDDPMNYPPFTMLLHAVLAHHGELENGAAVPPLCSEASIIHHADVLDAYIEIVRINSKESMWTDRIYFLGNRPHINANYLEPFTFREED